MNSEAEEIYEWLNKQGYQTEYEETGEYKMYYELDMPKILKAYAQHYASMKEPDEQTQLLKEKLININKEGYDIVCYEKDYGFTDNDEYVFDATHWQPLPTPPVKK